MAKYSTLLHSWRVDSIVCLLAVTAEHAARRACSATRHEGVDPNAARQGAQQGLALSQDAGSSGRFLEKGTKDATFRHDESLCAGFEAFPWVMIDVRHAFWRSEEMADFGQR